MRASGAGAPGTVDADVRVTLAPSAGGGTDLTYDADAVGGRGDRRRRPADARRGHQEDGRRVLHRARPRHRRAAPVGGAAAGPARRSAAGGGRSAAPASGAVYPGRAATANANATLNLDNGAGFAVGVLVGGLLALAGVALGARIGRAALMRAFTVAAVQVAPVPGPLTADVGRGQPRQAASTSPAAASRPPAPSWSCCPSRPPPASPPGCPTEQLWELVSELPGPVIEPLRDVAAELGVHLVRRHLRARARARRSSTTPRCSSTRAASCSASTARPTRSAPRPCPAAAGSPPATRSRCATPSSAGSA